MKMFSDFVYLLCQVRGYLAQGSYYNANKQLNSLFAKVRKKAKVTRGE